MTLEQLAALAQLPIAVGVAAVLVWLVAKVLAFIREERDAFTAQLALQLELFLEAHDKRDTRFTASIDSNTEVLAKLDGAVRELATFMRTSREFSCPYANLVD